MPEDGTIVTRYIFVDDTSVTMSNTIKKLESFGAKNAQVAGSVGLAWGSAASAVERSATRMAGAFAGLQSKVVAAKMALAGAGTAATTASGKFTSGSSAIVAYSGGLAKVTKNIVPMNSAISKSGGVLEVFNGKSWVALTNTGTLASRVSTATGNYTSYSKAATGAATATGGIAGTTGAATGQMTGFDTWIRRVTSALGVMAVFMAGRLAMEIISFYTEFETAMTKIVALVGIAQESVDVWAAQLPALATTTATSVNDLGDALFYITSAGIRGTETLTTLEQVAYASATGLGEMESVARTVVSAMNAWGKESLSAEQATGVLVATVKEGNLKSEELAGTFSKVIPIASSLGIEMGEVGAALAVLSRSGMDAAKATTGLRRLLMAIADPSEGARKAFEALGLDVDNLREMMGEKNGLQNVIRKLRVATEKDFKKIAETTPSLRALVPALTLINDKAGTMKLIFDSVNTDQTVTALGAFQKGADKTSRKIDLLSSAWDNFKKSFGETLGTGARDLIDNITRNLNLLNGAIDSYNNSTAGQILDFLDGIADFVVMPSVGSSPLDAIMNLFDDVQDRMETFQKLWTDPDRETGFFETLLLAHLPEAEAEGVSAFQRARLAGIAALEEAILEAEDLEEISRNKRLAELKAEHKKIKGEYDDFLADKVKEAEKADSEIAAVSFDRYIAAIEAIADSIVTGMPLSSAMLEEIEIVEAEFGKIEPISDQQIELAKARVKSGGEEMRSDIEKPLLEIDVADAIGVDEVGPEMKEAGEEGADAIVEALSDKEVEFIKNIKTLGDAISAVFQKATADALYAGLTGDTDALVSSMSTLGEDLASAFADGFAELFGGGGLGGLMEDWYTDLEVGAQKTVKAVGGAINAAAAAYGIYEGARAGEVGIGEGMMAGAAAGAVFGPWGAAIGAVAGGLIAAFTSESEDQIWAWYSSDYGAFDVTGTEGVDPRTLSPDDPRITGSDMGAATTQRFIDDMNRVVAVTSRHFFDIAQMFGDVELFSDLAEDLQELEFMVGQRSSDMGTWMSGVLGDEIPLTLLRNVGTSFKRAFGRIGFRKLAVAAWQQMLEMPGDMAMELFTKVAAGAIAMYNAMQDLDFDSLVAILERTSFDVFERNMTDALEGIAGLQMRMANETDIGELASDAEQIAGIIVEARQLELEMLAKIKQAQEAINATFDTMLRNVDLAGRGDDFKAEYYQDEFIDAIAAINRAVAPEDIQSSVASAQTAIQDLMGLVNEEDWDKGYKGFLASLGVDADQWMQEIGSAFGVDLSDFTGSTRRLFEVLLNLTKGESDEAFAGATDRVEVWADALELAALDTAEALNTLGESIVAMNDYLPEFDEQEEGGKSLAEVDDTMRELAASEAEIAGVMLENSNRQIILMEEFINTPPTVTVNIDGTLEPLIALIDMRIQTARDVGGAP